MQFVIGFGNLIVLTLIALFVGVIAGITMMALCSAARSDDDPLEETPFNKNGDLGEKYNDVYNKIEDNIVSDEQEVDD